MFIKLKIEYNEKVNLLNSNISRAIYYFKSPDTGDLPQATPAGWVVISYRDCAGCCGAAGRIVKMPTIKKIVDLPSGTTLEICPQQTPAGCVVVSYRDCAGCCGAAGQITKMPKIKKL